jgi:uncharacterized protein
MRKFFVILIFSFAIPAAVFAYVSPGSATGFVNDFAGVLSAGTKSTLETELTQFRADTTSEISVVTVKTIADDYIENYAEKLFQEWGIGTEKNDNGVLLVVATEDHKLRIEVGYGLEGALPDSIADSIIRNDMVPLLKENDFDGAVAAGVRSIMQATRGEYTAAQESESSPWSDLVFPIIFFGVFVLQWLGAILGRSKSWWLGGVLGFAGGAGLSLVDPFGFSFVAHALFALGLTGLGLFFDYVVSSTFHHAQKYGYDSPWWVGGNSGFGSGNSSGGFGGFGGGSSGGGGASGSW